jgi:hypothetical protein
VFGEDCGQSEAGRRELGRASQRQSRDNDSSRVQRQEYADVLWDRIKQYS